MSDEPVLNEEIFDYVIVGAGSAGCVLAVLGKTVGQDAARRACADYHVIVYFIVQDWLVAQGWFFAKEWSRQYGASMSPIATYTLLSCV